MIAGRILIPGRSAAAAQVRGEHVVQLTKVRGERDEITAIARQPRQTQHRQAPRPTCSVQPAVQAQTIGAVVEVIGRDDIHDGFPAWPSMDEYSRRSSRLSTLPFGFRGKLSRDTTPLIRCCLPTRALVHSTSSSVAITRPACRTTTASGVSPQRSLDTPTTATSATAGCSHITVSISAGEMFWPPQRVMSFLRSTM